MSARLFATVIGASPTGSAPDNVAINTNSLNPKLKHLQARKLGIRLCPLPPVGHFRLKA